MKVFSAEKLKSIGSVNEELRNIVNEAFESGWPQKCDGLTKEEMEERGFHCNKDWMVKKEEKK